MHYWNVLNDSAPEKDHEGRKETHDITSPKVRIISAGVRCRPVVASNVQREATGRKGLRRRLCTAHVPGI